MLEQPEFSNTFLTEGEILEQFGASTDQLNALVREGKLRQFRNDGEICYKVDELRQKLGEPTSSSERPPEGPNESDREPKDLGVVDRILKFFDLPTHDPPIPEPGRRAKFYSQAEVVERFGISVDDLQALVRDGELREFRDAGRAMYKIKEVEELDIPILLEKCEERASEQEPTNVFYSETEVFERFQTSEEEVRTLVREGGLRQFRDAGRVLYKSAEIEALNISELLEKYQEGHATPQRNLPTFSEAASKLGVTERELLAMAQDWVNERP